MVFMGAGPVPGETDLLEAAQADIEEMKKLFETQHEGPLNLFAQLNAGGQSGRYDIRGGTEDGVPAGERSDEWKRADRFHAMGPRHSW